MTATDKLRHMLDERGVEWWEPVQMEGSEFTRWHDANGVQWTASEVHGSNKLRIGASFITPEQAIEATLGCGTCHLTSAPQYGEGCQECSACGAVLDGYLFDVGRCPNCGAKVVDE